MIGTRKPLFRGSVASNTKATAQFYEHENGNDYLKVTSDSPRQVINVPVSLVTKALESVWDRDAQERETRVQAQQFQNVPQD